MLHAAEDTARRSADHKQPPVICFKLSGNTKLPSWYPENRSGVHNPVSLRPGYHFPEESVISILQCKRIFGGSDSLVWFTRFQQRAWPTHLPQSFFLLLKPPPESPRTTYSYSNSITMRSFAILATICAATVGTASGKNTVILVRVQHVCNAKGLNPIPGLNTLTEDLIAPIAKPGLTSTNMRDTLGYSDCPYNTSHSCHQGRGALGEISSQFPRRITYHSNLPR